MRQLLVAFILSAALALSSSAQSRLGQPEHALKIRNVEYRTKAALSLADRGETTRRLLQQVNDSVGGDSSKNLDQLRDMATEYARAMLQDQGYWRHEIRTKLVSLPRDQRAQWFDVVFDIEEGPQYYLSDIAWTGIKEFTQADLQRAMPIHSGEVASRRRIADGLEATRKLYGTRGYINCTFVPNTEIDDHAHLLALRIDVDEGAQFHFGNLNLPGLDEAHREMLLQRWESIKGTTYSPEKEEAFFRSVLWPAHPGLKIQGYPPYQEFLERRLGEKERTVDFSIRFAPPPPVENIH